MAETANALRVDIAVVSSEVNLIPLRREEQEQLLDETSFTPRIDLPGDTSLSKHRPVNDFIDHIDDYAGSLPEPAPVKLPQESGA